MVRSPMLIATLALLAAGCEPALVSGEASDDARPWVVRQAPLEMEALSLSPNSTSLSLSLFEHTGQMQFSSIDTSNTRTIWHGVDPTAPGSETTLVHYGKSWTGTVRRNGTLFRIVPNADGGARVIEIDESAMPPDEEPIPARAVQSDIPPPIGNIRRSNVDVLVAYTTQSRIAAGSKEAMEAMIALAMSESNQAYTDSGVAIRLRNVAMREVSGVESGDWVEMLDQLQTDNDGFFDEVHDLRDEVGADEVVLIVETDSACGIAYVMTDPSPSFEDNAFATVSRTCATGYYSFGHEIGHNMGSAHHRSYGETGAYDWSYGHRDPEGAFRTVMAYNCPGGCQRINRWSDPTAQYQGEPLGAGHSADEPADNIDTLDAVRAIVADFRPTGVVTPVDIALTAPAQHTFIGGVADLEWSGDGSVRVTLGATPGAADYAETTTNTGSWSVGGLPVNGSSVWVSLSKDGVRVDARFDTEPANDVALFSPSTSVNRTEQRFTWTDDGAPRFRLSIGSAPGLGDIVDVITQNPTVLVRSLPTGTLYVRVGSEFEGSWVYDTRTF